MPSRVLILSSPEDAHATKVAQHLTELNVQTVFWRYDPFVHDCQLNFAVGTDRREFKFNNGSAMIDMTSFDSIWHRRPGSLNVKQFFEPWIASMIEVEATHALRGMLYSLPRLWVNFPARDAVASLKLFQLEVAKNIGMAVPETIVTNEPESAKAFYEKMSGQVIYKLISEKSNFSLPHYEFPHGIPTLPVRDLDVSHFDQVRHAPHLFQERIQKKADIRVTVIGKKLFASHIESQAGKGKLDWRTDYGVPMKTWDLGDQLAEKCMQLLINLGLNYGAIDFCLDENEQHVFLEINSAGQYLWLEEPTKTDLSKEMALLLGGKSDPLVSYEHAAFGNANGNHP
ncbi:MAG: hypothetical protein JST89_17085 [Cyanobacteria bacterium SZAS-4]|nr:hypothetical protein [Cyanobacteria bacterium SZAS-4]